MYKRLIIKRILESQHSILLLGPRQTGKSTLIRSLQPDLSINLAREQTFLEFGSQPDLLERRIKAEKPKTIFVDEVQRLPSLLNTVQAILDENPKRYRFFLTGSSARKLKRGAANLLPGRILSYRLTPLSVEELGEDWITEKALSTGLLPGVYSEKKANIAQELLSSYAATYLKEEIQAEGLTKAIEGFSRFLLLMASKNGEFLDFAKLGAQAQVNQKTASRFFEILQDTLLVHRIDAYSHSAIQRLVRHPKFYFFDTGVLNGLLGNFNVSADRKGLLFETLVVNQLEALGSQLGEPLQLSTYRTPSGVEVDLILENSKVPGWAWAVEIKASSNIGKGDVTSLVRVVESFKKKIRPIIIYLGKERQNLNGVDIFSLSDALKELKRELKV